MSIKIGIYGYGNLGKGVEAAIKNSPDMELVAVFTRRDPETVKINTKTALASPQGLFLYKLDHLCFITAPKGTKDSFMILKH